MNTYTPTPLCQCAPPELLALPRGSSLFAAAQLMLAGIVRDVESLAATLHRSVRETRRLLYLLAERADRSGTLAALFLSGAEVLSVARGATPPPIPATGEKSPEAIGAGEKSPEAIGAGEKSPEDGAKNRPHAGARARDPLSEDLSCEIASALQAIGEDKRRDIEHAALVRLMLQIGPRAVWDAIDTWRRSNKAFGARSRTAVFVRCAVDWTQHPQPCGLVELEEWATHRASARRASAQRSPAPSRLDRQEHGARLDEQARAILAGMAAEAHRLGVRDYTPHVIALDVAGDLLVLTLDDEAAAILMERDAADTAPGFVLRCQFSTVAA